MKATYRGIKAIGDLCDFLNEALPAEANVRAERDPFTEDLYDEFMAIREQAHLKKQRAGYEQATGS